MLTITTEASISAVLCDRIIDELSAKLKGGPTQNTFNQNRLWVWSSTDTAPTDHTLFNPIIAIKGIPWDE